MNLPISLYQTECCVCFYCTNQLTYCVMSVIIAKPLIAVPTKAVGSMKATRNPDGSVLLSWQPLSLTEAKGFPLYIVSYKSVDGRSRGSINTTNSSVVINSLNSKVVHIFLIQVTTENGKNKGDTEYSKGQLTCIMCTC